MNENGATNKHSLWVGIGKQILSFVIGVIVAAYVVGSARQKISDVVAWKMETAPRIERMDSKGTLSFEKFHEEYLRTQARQEQKLAELEKALHDKQIADLKERIVTLERKPNP